MKRMTDDRIPERNEFQPIFTRDVPPDAPWNEMALPKVPAAEWPASLVLDHAIDRVVREVLGSGRSIQEAVARVTELVETLGPHLTQAEIRKRVHAQMIANS